MNFDNASFKGEFRLYQQRVLDNSYKFLKDKKINIVAAPGSGKTILGLELIRRLGNPCIILSPTITIRSQWGQRFEESFLKEDLNVSDYVSYNLNKIKLINSITYQALYSAVNKVESKSDEEEIDYSNIELFKLIKENNIKTICLDEAHHLQNEWQKALEKFVSQIDKDITVISLTATPPYDANKTEWDRYVSVCGEIDDEIFVPELVKENTLCPHQDYIIFNYPTDDEIDSFKRYNEAYYLAIDELLKLEALKDVYDRLKKINKEDATFIYQYYNEVIALLVLLHKFNLASDNKLYKEITNSKIYRSLNKKIVESAVTLLLTTDIINEEEKESIKKILNKYELVYRQKVSFELNEKLKRRLVSSSGKLTSIVKIVESETTNLKDDLRMLILTDYIKKESINNIGTDKKMANISIVSIFEEIRRYKNDIKVGCLSGSLIILPISVINKLDEYNVTNVKYTIFENTNFASVNIPGSNKEKVSLISRLFEEGKINLLIGTQALLGEGWDSPCINSLILASYVGSFVLSNQMRGRAIRSYKNNPNKTANIWHLVTIEPEYIFERNIFNQVAKYITEDNKTIKSYDYEVMIRRFNTFVGPNYETKVIESGIERITFIKPPYSKNGIDLINSKMLEKSKDRESIKTVWNDSLSSSARTFKEIEIPKENKVPPFTFMNMMALVLSFGFEGVVIASINSAMLNISDADSRLVIVIGLIASFFVTIFLVRKLLYLIIRNSSPLKSIKNISSNILKTLQDMEIINNGAKIHVETDPLNIVFNLSLNNATLYEQNVFNTAIKELLSPIDNPKYVIVRTNAIGRLDYSYSFACPTIIAKNSESVEIFKNYFKTVGTIKIIYAYDKKGKAIALKCKKRSFITSNKKMLDRYRVN